MTTRTHHITEAVLMAAVHTMVQQRRLDCMPAVIIQAHTAANIRRSIRIVARIIRMAIIVREARVRTAARAARIPISIKTSALLTPGYANILVKFVSLSRALVCFP